MTTCETVRLPLQSTPTLSLQNFGIFDESHPLKSAVIWGPIGVEAVLAQMLPENKSLFFQSFDVPAARVEGINFSAVLQQFGVTVITARDHLANALLQAHTDGGLTKQALVSRLLSKTRAFRTVFSTPKGGEEDAIVNLLEQDIERYGLDQALTLNDKLCNRSRLPMGNLLYARDQMNVLLGQRIVASMAKDIRKPEVGLYERVYNDYLTPHNPIMIPSGETFEGGDAYVHQKHVCVGVGPRTTIGAALSIYDALKPELDEYGFKFAVVCDDDPFGRPFSEQQNFMHLDTFSNPTGTKDIAVCMEEARRRKVRLISSFGGQAIVIDTQLSFIDYLEHTVQENHITVIPEDEQRQFGCNFLLLGETDGIATILAPLDSNTVINNQLRNMGKRVIPVDLYQSTKGYGAAHCMTGQLLRGNI